MFWFLTDITRVPRGQDRQFGVPISQTKSHAQGHKRTELGETLPPDRGSTERTNKYWQDRF